MARNKVVEFYTHSQSDREEWIDAMKNFVVMLDVKDKYTIGQLFGAGTFAKVHVCHNKRDST